MASPVSTSIGSGPLSKKALMGSVPKPGTGSQDGSAVQWDVMGCA